VLEKALTAVVLAVVAAEKAMPVEPEAKVAVQTASSLNEHN
jgi:hypothetical protein